MKQAWNLNYDLEEKVRNATEVLANYTLLKNIQPTPADEEHVLEEFNRVEDRLKSLAEQEPMFSQSSLEKKGLAYTTIRTNMKETIGDDSAGLTRFMKDLTKLEIGE